MSVKDRLRRLRWPWRAIGRERRGAKLCCKRHPPLCLPVTCAHGCHTEWPPDIRWSCSVCQPHGGVSNTCLKLAGHHGKHRDMWSERW